MRLSRRAYPHPVVGNGDDVPDAAFQCSIEPVKVGESFTITAHPHCSSKTIQRRMARGDATFALHVECSNTLYREVFEFTASPHAISIPAESLYATVEVNAFVRAMKPIKNYWVEGSHEDYEDARFRINVGDVLAVAEGQTFDADIDYDALRAISSIMQIRQNPVEGQLPMEAGLGDEKLTVYLCHQDYEDYQLIRKGYPQLYKCLVWSVVMPSLADALRFLQQEPETEFRWARCVKKRMEELGLKLGDDCLRNAQLLLELPFRKAFESARSLLDALE